MCDVVRTDLFRQGCILTTMFLSESLRMLMQIFHHQALNALLTPWRVAAQIGYPNKFFRQNAGAIDFSGISKCHVKRVQILDPVITVPINHDAMAVQSSGPGHFGNAEFRQRAQWGLDGMTRWNRQTQARLYFIVQFWKRNAHSENLSSAPRIYFISTTLTFVTIILYLPMIAPIYLPIITNEITQTGNIGHLSDGADAMIREK